ncbi:DUF484 family protein [Qingshengfaniella alkalisoli]|uniref:DUF484 family protein n=1 Tax=Qingshengfaniella alkalisoli TaxID=2599296 RepID=A0A5B8IXB8_9RHOB|nr:DUF484 family protein [Qingshengfaniella alkalisoli]QDY69541.1 DUF484 family protein [Qingshengfaniella alkalisoli]
MSTPEKGGDANVSLREAILSDPVAVLEDRQILEALVRAQDATHGSNVVDLRGLAMARLETRLDHLEETHQTVVSAAYDNVATTRQVHRAILAMLEPLTFDAFIRALDSEIRDCLRLRAVRLVLETATPDDEHGFSGDSATVSIVPRDFILNLQAQGRKAQPSEIILRQVNHGLPTVYGDAAADIRSEALVQINLGDARLPALLVLGSSHRDHFYPGQATDLLDLFSKVCERLLRSWLA